MTSVVVQLCQSLIQRDFDLVLVLVLQAMKRPFQGREIQLTVGYHSLVPERLQGTRKGKRKQRRRMRPKSCTCHLDSWNHLHQMAVVVSTSLAVHFLKPLLLPSWWIREVSDGDGVQVGVNVIR